jgi:hypothetical protein
MQTTPTPESRATSFSAVDDAGTPTSLKTFGGAYIFLWLGMLALVYLARRKQLALKAKLVEVEARLQRRI